MKSPALALLLALGASVIVLPATSDSITSGDGRLATDADITTAIDNSSSVTRLKRLLEYTGLAKAVRDPRFLAHVARGSNGRIGFMAFSWSANGKTDVIVPWMIISSLDEANVASEMFDNAATVDQSIGSEVRMTDVALAIRSAAAIEQASPFVANHTFINICSDGLSNAGASPRATRDRALAKGSTISAVLIFDRPTLSDYYSRNVIGGPGAFILPIVDSAAMSKLLTRKFWLDLAS